MGLQQCYASYKISKFSIEKISKAIRLEILEGIPGGFATEILREVSGRTMRGISAGSPAGILERITEEIPGVITKEISGGIFQGIPTGIPTRIPKRIPLGFSEYY